MRPTFPNHRKLLRACRILGEPRPHVIGYMELLWHACNETGDPYIGDADDIASAAEYPGEPKKLVQALLDCGGNGCSGLIEEDPNRYGYQIHNYFDHAPEYVMNRRKAEQERRKQKICESCGEEYRSRSHNSRYCSNACKMSAYRRRQTVTASDGNERNGDVSLRNSDVSVTSRYGTPAPAPAPAPSPTGGVGGRKSSANDAIYRKAGDSFEAFYKKYPRREGKLAAAKAWIKLTDEQREKAVEALPNHVAVFKNRAPDKVPYPASWLNGERWEDDLSGVQQQRRLQLTPAQQKEEIMRKRIEEVTRRAAANDQPH
jgi:hypothetical protein